jgi:hypothetical protein
VCFHRRLMGCGASSQGHHLEDELIEAELGSRRQAATPEEEKLHMVVDVNGDKAYVQVFDHPWNDLSSFHAARSAAVAADVAASAGALRSALKEPDYCRSPLDRQRRVVKLSLQAMTSSDGGGEADAEVRVVRCSMVSS